MSSSTENRKRIPDVTTGSIERHLVRLTIPTIGGMLAITIFNLTDTYFVSRLGTAALAAMGFTFPIVPRGQARIRTQISAAHSRKDLDFAIEKISEAKSELGI